MGVESEVQLDEREDDRIEVLHCISWQVNLPVFPPKLSCPLTKKTAGSIVVYKYFDTSDAIIFFRCRKYFSDVYDIIIYYTATYKYL